MINIIAFLSGLAVMLPFLYEFNTILFVSAVLVFIIVAIFWLIYD